MSPTTHNTADSDPDNDPGADPDADDLCNVEESGCGTHPFNADTDNDGLGLFDEYRYCTDPFNPDTDGDGVRDGDEVPHSPGSCPSDASDNGSSTNCVTLKLTVGDPSGSNSERWNLEVFEEATGRAVARHCDDGFGTPGSAEYSLVKGRGQKGRICTLYKLALRDGAAFGKVPLWRDN